MTIRLTVSVIKISDWQGGRSHYPEFETFCALSLSILDSACRIRSVPQMLWMGSWGCWFSDRNFEVNDNAMSCLFKGLQSKTCIRQPHQHQELGKC